MQLGSAATAQMRVGKTVRKSAERRLRGQTVYSSSRLAEASASSASTIDGLRYHVRDPAQSASDFLKLLRSLTTDRDLGDVPALSISSSSASVAPRLLA